MPRIGRLHLKGVSEQLVCSRDSSLTMSTGGIRSASPGTGDAVHEFWSQRRNVSRLQILGFNIRIAQRVIWLTTDLAARTPHVSSKWVAHIQTIF